MNDPIETEVIERDGVAFVISIYPDDDPENPREWDNLGRMVCWHRRYNLGDETILDRDEIENRLKEVEAEGGVIVPLYLYEHGGMTMRAAPFADPWDSGQVGFAYATRADILREYGGKRLTKRLKAHAREVLIAEVKTYDQYLRGDVCFYTVETEDGDFVDSCGGFFGLDACMAEARAAIPS